MRTLFSLACAAALCLGMSYTPAIGQDGDEAGPTYKLEIKFSQGETHRYEMKQEMSQEMDFGMGAMKTTMVNTTVMADTVREVGDDGSVVIASKTESMAMKMDNPFMKFEYDSAKPDAAAMKQYPMFRGAFAMVGETITVSLSAERKVTKIEGLKEIRQRLEKEASAEELEMMGDALDEDEMKRTMEAVYGAWPKDAIAVGGTWDMSMTVPAGDGASMKTEMTYKLDGVESRDGKKVALISLTGKLDFVPGGEMEGIEMEVKAQKIEGKIVFDMDKGETIESSTTITFDLNMEGANGAIKTSVTSTQKSLPAKAEKAAAGDEVEEKEEVEEKKEE